MCGTLEHVFVRCFCFSKLANDGLCVCVCVCVCEREREYVQLVFRA